MGPTICLFKNLLCSFALVCDIKFNISSAHTIKKLSFICIILNIGYYLYYFLKSSVYLLTASSSKGRTVNNL